MKEYTFATIDIGEEYSFTKAIKKSDMEYFLKISGDTNPLHLDDDYAQSKGFKSNVVYGMLTASMYSQLVGVHLPGKYCFLNRISIDFCNPVYINDVLKIKGKVTDKDDRFKILTIKARIYNQCNMIVSRANITVGFYE